MYWAAYIDEGERYSQPRCLVFPDDPAEKTEESDMDNGDMVMKWQKCETLRDAIMLAESWGVEHYGATETPFVQFRGLSDNELISAASVMNEIVHNESKSYFETWKDKTFTKDNLEMFGIEYDIPEPVDEPTEDGNGHDGMECDE